MFYSTGNNFGAGVIGFREAREDGYIVLNAKFSCSPKSEAYRSAEVLEVYVPELGISRSTESGVTVRFRETDDYGAVHDGGTFVRSWIRDSGTLCIEKLPVFDGFDEIIIYVQSLYCQLARGVNAEKGTRKAISASSADNCLSFDYDTFCVVFRRWVFYHMMFRSCTYAYRNLDWTALFSGMPEDVNADVPVITATNYNHPELGGVTESRLEEGVWMLPAKERGAGFQNSSSDVFSYAFLVRDDVAEDIDGRLRIEGDPVRGDGNVRMSSFALELSEAPAMAAVCGTTGQYGSSKCLVYPEAVPEGMPAFRAFLLASSLSGNRLCVHLVSMELSGIGARPKILFSAMSGESRLVISIKDISVAMAVNGI